MQLALQLPVQFLRSPSFSEATNTLLAYAHFSHSCVSVNDAFVMKAWGESLNAGNDIMLLADGNGEFTKVMIWLKYQGDWIKCFGLPISCLAPAPASCNTFF